jgi:hypothetical protein
VEIERFLDKGKNCHKGTKSQRRRVSHKDTKAQKEYEYKIDISDLVPWWQKHDARCS